MNNMENFVFSHLAIKSSITSGIADVLGRKNVVGDNEHATIVDASTSSAMHLYLGWLRSLGVSLTASESVLASVAIQRGLYLQLGVCVCIVGNKKAADSPYILVTQNHSLVLQAASSAGSLSKERRMEIIRQLTPTKSAVLAGKLPVAVLEIDHRGIHFVGIEICSGKSLQSVALYFVHNDYVSKLMPILISQIAEVHYKQEGTGKVVKSRVTLIPEHYMSCVGVSDRKLAFQKLNGDLKNWSSFGRVHVVDMDDTEKLLQLPLLSIKKVIPLS